MGKLSHAVSSWLLESKSIILFLWKFEKFIIVHCKQGGENIGVMLKGLLLMQFIFPSFSPLATHLNNFLPHSMFVLDIRLSVIVCGGGLGTHNHGIPVQEFMRMTGQCWECRCTTNTIKMSFYLSRTCLFGIFKSKGVNQLGNCSFFFFEGHSFSIAEVLVFILADQTTGPKVFAKSSLGSKVLGHFLSK